MRYIIITIVALGILGCDRWECKRIHTAGLNIYSYQIVDKLCSTEEGMGKMKKLYDAHVEKSIEDTYNKLENKPSVKFEKDNKLLKECQSELNECKQKSCDIPSRKTIENNKVWSD